LNRRVLIGIIIAVVGIGLIGLGVLVINNILRKSLTPPTQATQIAVATSDIVIASLVPRDALSTVESVLGKITVVHIIQGEMVLQHNLADPTNVSHDIGYVIGKGQVLMAFPANDLMSSLGVLQRGDNIDLFASVTVEVTPTNTTVVASGQEAQPVSRMFTFDALQRVQVSAIVVDVITEQSSNNPTQVETQSVQNPTNVRVKAYLLALDAQDALVLKNMRDSGATFDIVLRSPSSNELFDVSPVTVEYLLQRYELQIPR
jgi:hypothetical protein